MSYPYSNGESPLCSYDLEALFAQNKPRLAHMRDAGAFAQGLAQGILDPDVAQLLERSALLHDIGYAESIRKTGYHPLDGAIFLERAGEHPWVIEGVLRHSGADRKGASMPGIAEHYAVRPPQEDSAWLVRAVTLADWRSAGVGGRVSFGQRVQDIVTRHPGDLIKAERTRTMVHVVRGWFAEWAAGYGKLPWIFCDIDQTFIVPGEALSAENKAAVKAYVTAGGFFSLATGKHPLSIAPLVEELGLTTPQLTVNGTCMLQNGQTEVLAHLGAKALQLVDVLVQMNLPVAIYREHCIESRGPWIDLYDELYDTYGEIRPVRTPQDGVVLKVLCIADQSNPEREKALRHLANELGVICCRSDRLFVEFLPVGGSKGDGVARITGRIEWPLLNTVAIGDNENDATMFACCGACAAVGNAQENARVAADVIVESCAESGVGKLLERFRFGGWAGLY